MHSKVRPENRRENEFRVRVLIQHEVAQPLFPAGPDQQIHIRLSRGIQVIRNRLLRDLIFPQGTVPYQRGDLSRGPHQFRAPAVVHGDIQPEPRILLCPVFRLDQRFPLFLRQTALVSQDQDPYVLGVQLIDLGSKEIQDQLHQRGYFLFRPVPVLRGEGIQAQGTDPQVICMADDLPQGFRSLPVTSGHVQLMLFCPAAVPVHDDSYMLRQLVKLIRCPWRLFQGQ